MTRGVVKVVAGIILEHGRILICQRKPDGAFPLKWEFPGGKVETGEALENALIRELEEELGIRVENPEEFRRYRYMYETGFEVDLCFFIIRRYSGRLENKVFQQITLASVDDLSQFDFLEGDRPLIEALRSERLGVYGKDARKN
jgi:8-oxo-dGTP diphosphatase